MGQAVEILQDLDEDGSGVRFASGGCCPGFLKSWVQEIDLDEFCNKVIVRVGDGPMFLALQILEMNGEKPLSKRELRVNNTHIEQL